MSIIARPKHVHQRPLEPVTAPKTAPKASLEDSARARCPIRGRPKGLVGKEKKLPTLQIVTSTNKKSVGRPLTYPVPGEDKKESPRLSRESGEDSFKAEENENELRTCTVMPVVMSTSGRGARGTLVAGKPRRGKSPPLREHFEAEMNKHGLLDRIVNIQQLNNFFESEIGGNKRDTPSYVSESGGSNSQLDKILEDNSPATALSANSQGFIFPFQKRARSNSPPRNGQLFDPKRKESPGRQPIVANFFVGKSALQRRAEFPESDPITVDTARLSTGCTREDQGSKKAKPAIEEEDWMYKRLDPSLGNNTNMGGAGREDKELLRIMNQISSSYDAE